MTNRVEIIITADNQARAEFTALNASVRSVSDTLDRAGQHGATSTRTIAQGADAASDAVRETTQHVGRLSDELDDSARSARRLADATDEVDRAESRRERNRSRRSDPKSDVPNLPDLPTRWSLPSTSFEMPDIGAFAAKMKPAMIGVALGSLPAIADAAAAAVLGALGAGALAAGIASAAQSQDVQNAFMPIKQTAITEFAQAGEAFRKPLISVAGDFNDTLKSVDLAGLIRPLAAEIKPLSDGLNGLVKNALPGIRHAVEASVPVIDTLAQHLPEIGQAISDLGDDFADSGDEAAETFHDILSFTEVTIGAIGNMVKVLSTVGGFFRDIRDNMADWHPMAKFAEWVAGGEDMHSTTVKLNQTTEQSAVSFEDAAKAAAGYTMDLKRLSDTLDGAWGKQMGVDEATLRFNQSLLDLKSSIKDNGKTLDEHTEHGIANREAMLGSADAAYRMFQAEVDLTGSVATAGPKLNENLKALEANAIKAGLNADQVRALLAQYYALASSPDINKTITVKTRYTKEGTAPVSGSYADIPTGRIGGYSTGGRVRMGSGLRDDVNARLTKDEIVLNTRDVAALGGPDRVERWRQNLHSGSSGMPESPAGGGSPGGGFAPAGGHFTLGSDGSALGDVLMNLIARSVRSAGGRPDLLGIKTKG